MGARLPGVPSACAPRPPFSATGFRSLVLRVRSPRNGGAGPGRKRRTGGAATRCHGRAPCSGHPVRGPGSCHPVWRTGRADGTPMTSRHGTDGGPTRARVAARAGGTGFPCRGRWSPPRRTRAGASAAAAAHGETCPVRDGWALGGRLGRATLAGRLGRVTPHRGLDRTAPPPVDSAGSAHPLRPHRRGRRPTRARRTWAPPTRAPRRTRDTIGRRRTVGATAHPAAAWCCRGYGGTPPRGHPAPDPGRRARPPARRCPCRPPVGGVARRRPGRVSP